MMESILLVAIALLGIWFMYGLAKAYQLHKFADYMRASIHELYHTDKHKTLSIDIDQSYQNLLKSAAWNHKFENMVIYANRS